MDKSEAVEVKIVNKEGSADSYFFAYFHDIQAALEHIRDAVRSYRLQSSGSPQEFLDTTTRPLAVRPDRSSSLSASEPNRSSSRLPSFLRPLQDTLSHQLGRIPNAPSLSNTADEYTHISKSGTSSFVPVATSACHYTGNGVVSPVSYSSPPGPTLDTASPSRAHTYPPASPANDSPSLFSGRMLPSGMSWNVSMPSLLRSTRKAFSNPTSASSVNSMLLISQHLEGVRELCTSPQELSFGQSSSAPIDLGYSVLETTEAVVDPEATVKFRVAFAFDEKEILLGCMQFLLSLVTVLIGCKIFLVICSDFYHCTAVYMCQRTISVSSPLRLSLQRRG